MSALYIMVGLPGSGKSTYAKETLLKANPDWAYVSRDEVRYQYVSDQEHYFDKEDEVYREFCNRIEMYLLQNKNVIADATHLTVGSRKKLVNKLRVKPDKMYAIFMDTPFDTCMARNAERTGITRVPDQQMYRMKNGFKRPEHYEGFETIYRIH